MTFLGLNQPPIFYSVKATNISHSEIKDNWISSRLNPTVYSSSLQKKSSLVTSKKRTDSSRSRWWSTSFCKDL